MKSNRTIYLYEKIGEEAFNKIISRLPEREQKVLKMRCGIETNRPYTLEETGLHLGVCRGRAKQIESKALRRL
jgi:RNA polymerase primary sigma factor